MLLLSVEFIVTMAVKSCVALGRSDGLASYILHNDPISTGLFSNLVSCGSSGIPGSLSLPPVFTMFQEVLIAPA